METGGHIKEPAMSVCLPCFRHELVFISSSEAHRQPILPPTHRGENAIAKLKCGELAAGGMSSRELDDSRERDE